MVSTLGVAHIEGNGHNVEERARVGITALAKIVTHMKDETIVPRQEAGTRQQRKIGSPFGVRRGRRHGLPDAVPAKQLHPHTPGGCAPCRIQDVSGESSHALLPCNGARDETERLAR